MRLKCFTCHKPVSSEVPDDTLVRGTLECPECLEKRPDYDDALLAILRLLLALGDVAVATPANGQNMTRNQWDELQHAIEAGKRIAL